MLKKLTNGLRKASPILVLAPLLSPVAPQNALAMQHTADTRENTILTQYTGNTRTDMSKITPKGEDQPLVVSWGRVIPLTPRVAPIADSTKLPTGKRLSPNRKDRFIEGEIKAIESQMGKTNPNGSRGWKNLEQIRQELMKYQMDKLIK